MTDQLPGQAWMDIVRAPTFEQFAAAFAEQATLDSSAGRRAVAGAAQIRRFFDATRAMYDSIAFDHEITAGNRTVLEWSGQFQGAPIAGATILTRDDDGRISGIQLYHRPYQQVIAFSSGLAATLAGKV